jgi:uncharacterized protein
MGVAIRGMIENEAEADGSRELDDLFDRFGIDDDWALGFFAGVVTGPEEISPTVWLPAFMGDNEFDGEADMQLGVKVLAQLHTAVGVNLRSDPTELCPDADDTDGVTEFCKGYIRGAALHPTWMKNERGLALLCIMTALAGEIPESELLGPGDKPPTCPEPWLESQRRQLGAHVGELFAMFDAPRVPFVAKPKVNRNDACPCGSGKKYKKCCLS